MSYRAIDSPKSSRTSRWRNLLDALRGRQRDYTYEPLKRALFLLAVPTVVEMLMESLFSIVDIFWVSRLGPEAVAVVGLTESVMSVIYAIAIGVATATAAIVARRIGENAIEAATQSVAQALMLSFIAAAGLGILFGYFAVDILKFMGGTSSIVESGAIFAHIMFGGNVTVFMIFLINAIFRSAGNTVLAMRTLLLANLLNIVLGPWFIFGWGPVPQFGLTGAAIATNIGRGIGVLYQVWHLTRPFSRMRLQLYHFRPAPRILRKILFTSTNGTAQLLIDTTSGIGLFKILATFGSAALAGYTIATRIAVFGRLPACGLSTAAATLVGQNLGASQPDRAEAAVQIATRRNVTLLSIIGAILVFFPDVIVRLFTMDPQVHAYAVCSLRITSLAFPLYAVGMCMGAAFNGAGDTWTPTRMNFCCLWLGQIPFSWLLAEVFHLGPLGIFIAVPTSLSALALISYMLFRRGEWKLLKI